MRAEIVHDDDVGHAQGREEDFAHIRMKDLGVGRSFDCHALMQTLVQSERTEEIIVVVCQWPCGA